jgi:hypothetical protein
MSDSDELLKAIAALGGLDAFDVLDYIVSPSRSDRAIDTRGPLLRKVLSFILSANNEDDDNRVKQILWDARVATLVSKKLTAAEKAQRLEALDGIGIAVLQE